MLNGDISNDAPKRVLVAESLVIVKQPRVEKRFKFIPVVKHDLLYDRVMLNKLWQYTTQKGITLELISFEHSEDELAQIYDQLDSAGVNPFRGYSYYKSPSKLAADLAFRPEVFGVLDPENMLRYGSKGLDL
jgi:hypothetical protein